jgi:hypothetical protein
MEFIVICDDCKGLPLPHKVFEHGAVSMSPGKCKKCDGVGKILTDDGKKLAEFLLHWDNGLKAAYMTRKHTGGAQ